MGDPEEKAEELKEFQEGKGLVKSDENYYADRDQSLYEKYLFGGD